MFIRARMHTQEEFEQNQSLLDFYTKLNRFVTKAQVESEFYTRCEAGKDHFATLAEKLAERFIARSKYRAEKELKRLKNTLRNERRAIRFEKKKEKFEKVIVLSVDRMTECDHVLRGGVKMK